MRGAILTMGPYREGQEVWCDRGDGTRYRGIVGMVDGETVYVVDAAQLERFSQTPILPPLSFKFSDDEREPSRMTFPWPRRNSFLTPNHTLETSNGDGQKSDL